MGLFSDDVAVLEKLLRAAQAKCDKASDARRALPPGSSRARVANKIDNARRVASALERG